MNWLFWHRRSLIVCSLSCNSPNNYSYRVYSCWLSLYRLMIYSKNWLIMSPMFTFSF